jgi:hypothetical protein
MLKTIIRTTACLAVSATAFIAVTKMDARAAKPRSPSVPETTEAKPAPSKAAPPAPAPKLTVASVKATPATTASTQAPATTKPADAAALPTLPNWKGKRLSVARREARKLGVDVTAVDESGDPVPPELASSYRVRRQLAQVGSAVQVVVREIVDAAAGY